MTTSQGDLDKRTQNLIARTGKEVRVDAWRAIFEKTNRILSERPVQVRIRRNVPYGMEETPGWSDGEVINFNGPMLDNLIQERDPVNAVLRMKGLNYHELSHVLYTPRMSDELPKRIVERAKKEGHRWWYAFNALEDQRIETWFSSVYGASKRYFEAAVLQWLIEKGTAEAATLVYGRKYLPASLRVKAGRVFTEKYDAAIYEEFKQVIDAYLQITFPRETNKAYGLVAKYKELLDRLDAVPQLPIPDNGCHGGGVPGNQDEGVARKGRILVAVQRQAQEAAEDAMADAAEADEAEEQAQAEAAAEKQSGAGEKQEGNGEGDADNGSPDIVVTVQTGKGGAGASAEGSALDQQQTDPGKALADALKDLIDSAYDGMDDLRVDSKIQQDVNDVMDAIKAAEASDDISIGGQVARNKGGGSPSAEALMSVRRVVQVLTRLRTDLEADIIRQQTVGRLDLRKAILRRPTDTGIFVKWDEGCEDAAEVDAVVLVDVSGSMNGIMSQANEALWVLKRSFDKLDIRTTVLLFDTRHMVLFQPGQKAHRTELPAAVSGGGTDPMTALEQAYRVLSRSHASNKVLISITDGAWSGNEATYKGIMTALHNLGVTSMLLGLGGAAKAYGSHHHTITHDLKSISELPKAATALVATLMRRAAGAA